MWPHRTWLILVHNIHRYHNHTEGHVSPTVLTLWSLELWDRILSPQTLLAIIPFCYLPRKPTQQCDALTSASFVSLAVFLLLFYSVLFQSLQDSFIHRFFKKIVYVAQVGLKLVNPTVQLSRGLRSQACAPNSSILFIVLMCVRSLSPVQLMCKGCN